MSMLDLLTTSIPAVQWAHLHSRDLQHAILQNWSYGESLEKQIRIPSLVKRKLWWWSSQTNMNRSLFWTFPAAKALTTDASSWGWGTHLESQMAQASWTIEETKRSSKWGELRAILLELWSFKEIIRGQHIQILSDNATVLAYISRQGGTRSRILLTLALQILTWAENNMASMTAVHLKGQPKSSRRLLKQKMGARVRMEPE